MAPPDESTLADRLQDDLRRWSDELRRRHGWTHVEIDLEVDAARRQIVARGEIAVDRLRPALAARLENIAGPGWTAAVESVGLVTGGSWHAVTEPALVWQADPRGAATRRLATEVLPEGGPIQCLARLDDASVVRLRDGTVAWHDGPLGAEVDAQPLGPPHARDPIVVIDAARRRLGWTYRLGGASRRGIDCSALVQRALHEATGILVPRHSRDQLSLAPMDGPGPGELGDLLFVWTAGEALCHVAMTSADNQVVHASLTRRAVVQDDRRSLIGRARAVMHVRFDALVAHGAAVQGTVSLAHAGVRLGMTPKPELKTPADADRQTTD